METNESSSSKTVPYNDPSQSFIKLKKIRLGDEVLARYQQKLLEIRSKYRADEATNDTFSFYHDISEETSQPPENRANFKKPTDNIFAYFLFYPAKKFNETNDWFLYWNPNLESEDNENLNWDLSRVENMPESKTKQIALAIKHELTDAGFSRFFRDLKNSSESENKFAFDDFDDDEFYDMVAHKSSSYDSDDSDEETYQRMHYMNHPDPESYPRDYTAFDSFD